MLRKYFPPTLKKALFALNRKIKDRIKGEQTLFSNKSYTGQPFAHKIDVRQRIMPGAHYENKCYNIGKAANQVSFLYLPAGAIFSFLHCIGDANAKAGYKPARNLVAGKISEEFGGGLCQLASILYHTGLKAGFTVLERYNHSVDIYKEEERFTPLGADAAIVFPYKDLRLKNPYPFACYFVLSMIGEDLLCELYSEQVVSPLELQFEREEKGNQVSVKTLSLPERKILAYSTLIFF